MMVEIQGAGCEGRDRSFSVDTENGRAVQVGLLCALAYPHEPVNGNPTHACSIEYRVTIQS
jgi:hypothetical protein